MNTAIENTSTVLSQDGTTISYLSVGSGPAVIVVPGALSLARDYTAFARALAEHFTVHTMERRGRGQSGPQGSDYSIKKECEDVLALQRQTNASLLVGHSFGGLVALESARNNQAFTRVAVYEPGVSIDGSIPAGWIPGYEKKLAENKKLDAFVEFTLAMGPESARKTPPWLMKRMLPLFMKSHELKTILSLLQENLSEHKEVAHLDNSYKNYREIAASVLLMHGGKGNTPQADTSMKRLAAVFQHVETRKFPALDHFGLNKTGPQEVARAVSAYFL
ncbi:alpha/beta hydrolase [Ktedonobacter racemifer]|uniref:Alpha/beta hydrolase fold protein n=1 Tax=Ktedonobacter racemifer DSM 44963 TaxID=485913 RepID=D6U6W2_KTERA|nr:alpha/beta hydrolase [Ktedonobacter racemifer]EFH80723.1 alpha/beta hydrolase fold protein [Ktedonobacter racemifer DSM 44963]